MYEGAASDRNICLNPLTTDKHVLDMVQVVRANRNEVEIYAQHVVDNDEVELVLLSSEEKDELERDRQESMRNVSMGTTEVDAMIMEVDILIAE